MIEESLEIRAPSQFQHAGVLSARFDRADPRADDFPKKFLQVTVDLRDCDFVRPAAAMWVVTYLLTALRRGCTCHLLVPENLGVAAYLKSTGVFSVLGEAGVNIDDRDVPARQDRNVVVPITRYANEQEASTIVNNAHEYMSDLGNSPANLASVVAELFSELVLNAVQHSESEAGAVCFAQFVQTKTSRRLRCAVADGGVGVYTTLVRNPKHRSRVYYDWDALDLAIRERVSGTSDEYRGIGLYEVGESVSRPGSSLLLHSGLGKLTIKRDTQRRARRTRLFPGTLAVLSVEA